MTRVPSTLRRVAGGALLVLLAACAREASNPTPTATPTSGSTSEAPRRVLFVVSSHTTLGDTGRPTGYFFPEVAHVYYPLVAHGVSVDFAKTGDGTPQGYGGDDDPETARLRADAPVMNAIASATPLANVDVDRYDAYYFPGGHGTMWDFPGDPSIVALLHHAESTERWVAAVCHGPAAFVGATRLDGRPYVEGRPVAAFSDEEERRAQLDEVVPFLLETRLREAGATLEPAPAFEPRLVEDDHLLTGQNPASAAPLAQRLLEVLGS
ncbi:MAG: type 1 glutamine amidotransferase domain-containing protein [Sandaracinus sp.]|nr:type 1 glutamine amidotransferase domain-containing protein [Sandaracinus sp.]